MPEKSLDIGDKKMTEKSRDFDYANKEPWKLRHQNITPQLGDFVCIKTTNGGFLFEVSDESELVLPTEPTLMGSLSGLLIHKATRDLRIRANSFARLWLPIYTDQPFAVSEDTTHGSAPPIYSPDKIRTCELRRPAS